MRPSRLLLPFLAAGLTAWVSPQACAQATLTTLFTNGPTANRSIWSVLSEGYTAGQLGQFLIDARNAVSNLLAVPPYFEYSNYFNAFAISVASVQSGSDHYTPSVSLVNTYFNSTYDSYVRSGSLPSHPTTGTETMPMARVKSTACSNPLCRNMT